MHVHDSRCEAAHVRRDHILLPDGSELWDCSQWVDRKEFGGDLALACGSDGASLGNLAPASSTLTVKRCASCVSCIYTPRLI